MGIYKDQSINKGNIHITSGVFVMGDAAGSHTAGTPADRVDISASLSLTEKTYFQYGGKKKKRMFVANCK
jgi:hypothetical protein